VVTLNNVKSGNLSFNTSKDFLKQFFLSIKTNGLTFAILDKEINRKIDDNTLGTKEKECDELFKLLDKNENAFIGKETH
jgi:hypothetical protein